MKKIVMECHPGYAVVLDESGRFTKVANMNYEVGQTVTNVVELAVPESKSAAKRNIRWIYYIAAVAACLMLILIPHLILSNAPFASVYMSINPEVRIDINRNDIVVGLEGINADGVTLIEDYKYKRKNLNLVLDELIDRAIEMEFLHESGGKITLTLDANNNEWVVSRRESLNEHLNEYLTRKIAADIEVADKGENRINIIINPDNYDGNNDVDDADSSNDDKDDVSDDANAADSDDVVDDRGDADDDDDNGDDANNEDDDNEDNADDGNDKDDDDDTDCDADDDSDDDDGDDTDNDDDGDSDRDDADSDGDDEDEDGKADDDEDDDNDDADDSDDDADERTCSNPYCDDDDCDDEYCDEGPDSDDD